MPVTAGKVLTVTNCCVTKLISALSKKGLIEKRLLMAKKKKRMD